MEALPPSPLYPSRRRLILRRILALILLAAIGLSVAVLAFDVNLPLVGDDDAKEDLTKPPALTEATTVREDGLTVGWPASWSDRRSGGLGGPLRLASADGSVTVALSAPAIVKKPRGRGIVLNDAIKAIRRNYERVRVTRVERPAPIGGYPTRQAVILAQNKRGVPLRILVAVAWKKKLAYLVEVFTAENAPPRRIVEAQTVLTSVRLSK
jgi:hypothetical protein